MTGINYLVKYGVHAWPTGTRGDRARRCKQSPRGTRSGPPASSRGWPHSAISDGSSVLDNTVVVLWSETSEAHAHEGIPVMLFGGRRLGLRGGRCLRYGGRPSNNLWATLAPLFGVTLDKFGGLEQAPVALPELLG